MAEYQAIIGLEVHAQLSSKSKMFCGDEAAYGAPPNTLVSAITLAHPGTLPSVNKACVEMAIKAGLAMNCEIASRCHFARKNYFYPDLPKGYQISQDDTPICRKGKLEIRLKDGGKKTIGITRIHLEEDAGKSYHDHNLYYSLVDFNRAGVPLIEIVSEPDLRSSEEATAYLTEVRKIVRYLGICDGNMEEGSLRCDANVSIHPKGSDKWGARVEVKNMNSISNVGRAINYEIERQKEVLEGGGTVAQETRTWDAATGSTIGMRDKETSADYRYFPEPDLQGLEISAEMIERIEAELPELPEALYEKFMGEYGLPEHDAALLSEQREFAQYYQDVLYYTHDYKTAANWLNGPIKAHLNEHALDITEFPLKPARIAEILELVAEGKVSHSVAKDQLFALALENPETEPLLLAEKNGLILESDTGEIEKLVEQTLDANADKVSAYLGGKTGLLGFFTGQVMKQAGGKADPKVVNQMLKEKLDKINA